MYEFSRCFCFLNAAVLITGLWEGYEMGVIKGVWSGLGTGRQQGGSEKMTGRRTVIKVFKAMNDGEKMSKKDY